MLSVFVKIRDLNRNDRFEQKQQNPSWSTTLRKYITTTLKKYVGMFNVVPQLLRSLSSSWTIFLATLVLLPVPWGLTGNNNPAQSHLEPPPALSASELKSLILLWTSTSFLGWAADVPVSSPVDGYTSWHGTGSVVLAAWLQLFSGWISQTCVVAPAMPLVFLLLLLSKL